MNRREFIKETLLTTAVLASVSGKAFAGEYGEISKKDINRLKNKKTPSIGEQKHVPAIEAPDTIRSGSWFDVKIKVGFKKEHPSTPGHWITMIKLIADGKEVAKTGFKTGGISAPTTTFRIRLENTSTVEAIENCNLHGTWISDPVKIKVI
jgi:superoxide reductase